ncbi:MAG: hypothetical protein PVSMB1_05950 [Gemmatimonadaceae bacterium]
MPARYFVEVFAPDENALRRLREFGFDLFAPTARRVGERFVIDGLISLEDTARLVAAGYHVLIKSEERTHARGNLEISEFSDWIAARLAERQASSWAT